MWHSCALWLCLSLLCVVGFCGAVRAGSSPRSLDSLGGRAVEPPVALFVSRPGCTSCSCLGGFDLRRTVRYCFLWARNSPLRGRCRVRSRKSTRRVKAGRIYSSPGRSGRQICSSWVFLCDALCVIVGPAAVHGCWSLLVVCASSNPSLCVSGRSGRGSVSLSVCGRSKRDEHRVGVWA